MMCYPPTGYIMFSLKGLKFYGGWGPDNPNTQIKQLSPAILVSHDFWRQIFASFLCSKASTFMN